MPDVSQTNASILIGGPKIQAVAAEICELRARCDQQDDLTTDPHYFVASNTLHNKRVVAVLFRQREELEACVFFYERCMFGLGLGLLSGGDITGEGLVIAPRGLRVAFIDQAVQAILRRWQAHSISVSMRASLEESVRILGPESKHRMFAARNIQHRLRLECTYGALLARMGPRTRRSLDGKRQQLEKRAPVSFLPALAPAEALEAMLALRLQSLPERISEFYHARYRLLLKYPELFCMGIRSQDGTWLSVLSGWRRNRITYIDLQMNNVYLKKESLSAVMRAFMLEHEIGCRQELIDFVGGTSLLLRRYCQPSEPSTNVLVSRPGMRAALFKMVVPRAKADSVYERVQLKPDDQVSDHS